MSNYRRIEKVNFIIVVSLAGDDGREEECCRVRLMRKVINVEVVV